MTVATSLPTGTITFVFTDIEGSTRLLTAVGSDYPRLLARHNELIRAQIAAANGIEVKTEGDSFFIVFTSATDAVAFASAAQGALARADWPRGVEIRVRIGIHTGAGMLSGGDYVGLDVHRAARVSAAAHGGQVLLSDSSRALAAAALPDGLSLRDLGEHRLKDLPAPVRLFQLDVDGLPSDFPPIRSLGRGNLPAPLTSFVGREADIAAVSMLLGQARLVTLTGPGGTGKTRLSIEVARRAEESFPDGAWFVPLDAVTDPDIVIPTIARAIGVKEDSTRAPIEYLGEALAQRRLLLVLDNLEQVVAAAPQIGQLLSDAPAPRVLCSSREVLRVSGEHEYPVPPLESDPAVRLFIERARQVRPDFDPHGEELDAIEQICRAVDGLPLAIELAAARIRLFAPQTLLARLTDRLDALQSGGRDLPERQRTLRGAIEWSYDLLDESERQVFARLAVFFGGADITGIEAVADPAGEVTTDVLSTLTSLLEKSLIRAESGRGGEPRFRMLETIREYAAERLEASGEGPHLRDRHLAYFVQLAEAVEPELTGDQPDLAFARVGADHDNVRAAIEWSRTSGNPDAGLRIGGAIWRFWQQRGHLGEGRAIMERLLEAPASRDDPEARARGLTGYGGVIYWQGDYGEARAAYEEALTLYRAAGDESRVALALFDLAFTLLIDHQLEEANRMFEESSAIFTRLGDERGRLMVGTGMSGAALIAGDLERARDIAEAAVADFRRLGMKFRLADTLGFLTAIYLRLGDAPSARSRLAESLTNWKVIADLSAYAGILQFGAGLALLERRYADAARLMGALQALRDGGEPFLSPSEVIGLPDPEAETRAALSPEAYVAAFEEGRSWARDDALEHAAG